MLDTIYNAFLNDPVITGKVNKRIKYYEYPETGNIDTCIIIDPLDTSKPSDFADNKWLTEDYLYQIEVWSKVKSDRDVVAKQVQKVMWDELGFANYGGGVDEWDRDLKIYRDARRYRGKEYRNDLDSL